MRKISREQTRQNYDRMSRWYDLFASSERKFTQIGLQLLGVKPGEHVLEIGFGTGHSLITLVHQATESGLVAGVELSSGMIEVARKRMQDESPERSAKMLRGDGTSLPFIPNSFDVVLLSFTLELFSDDEIPVVLDQCHRILKPEGRLGLISLAKQDVLACRPIELRKSLKTGGFRVQAAKVQTMWGLPVEIALARPLN
jgi:ubiquinone/menaquinone biosynthesis C-methylase UbiE